MTTGHLGFAAYSTTAGSMGTTPPSTAFSSYTYIANNVTLTGEFGGGTADYQNLQGPDLRQSVMGWGQLQNIDLTNANFATPADMTLSAYGTTLLSVKMPENMKTIPDGFLQGCTLITELVIPNSYTTIGNSAFNNMQGLKKITIGSGVETVGTSCYEKCKSLETVIFVTGSKHIFDNAFSGVTTIKYVTMPEGVVSIGKNAFKQCHGLLAISLPNTLETIDENAFYECNQLTSVTIPASVKSIATGAFGNSPLIQDIYCLGTAAPTCAAGAFGGNTCDGSGGDNSGVYREAKYHAAITTTDGALTTSGKIFGFLHFPSGITETEKEKYTDVTRVYTGADTEEKLNDAGTTYMWPTLSEYTTAYTNATNGFLQDGTTTYETQYAGWHQLTIVGNSVGSSNTYTFTNVKDNTWWTICVPFDMTKIQVSNTFGSYTEVCDFNGVTRNTTDKSITLNFKTDNVTWDGSGTDEASTIIVKAHHPYLIHPSKAPAAESSTIDYTVTGITPEDETDANLEAQKVSVTAVDENAAKLAAFVYTFKGNYTSTFVPIPQYAYFLGWNSTDKKAQFYVEKAANNRTSGGQWKPYTAVITCGAGDDSFNGAAAKVNMTFETEVTGIKTIETVDAKEIINHDRVFNMNGQLVRSGSASLEGLPKGMYIVNGKKYIVR